LGRIPPKIQLTPTVVSLQKLARRLELLGRVAISKLGEWARNVGREILVEFPLSSVEKDEGGKDVDGEAEEWKMRVIEQYYLGNFKRAIASFDKALEIKPDDHLASKNRTIALKKLGIV